MANATIYVDNVSGNNANAGTSEALAVADLATAIGLISGGGNTIYVQNTGTDYAPFTISGLAGDSTNGPNILEGYTTTPGARDGGHPTFASSTNSQAIFTISNASNYWYFRHIKAKHTAATRGAPFTTSGSTTSNMPVPTDCIFDGVTQLSGTLSPVLVNCQILNTTNTTAAYSGNTLTAIGCYFAGNAGANMRNINGAGTLTAHNCIFSGGTYGIQDATGSAVTFDVRQSVFFDQDNGGIYLASTGNKATRLFGNVFFGITGFGIDNAGADKNNWLFQVINHSNAYGSNSSGNLNNYPAGFGDVALTVDPFANSSGSGFASIADAFAAFAPNSTAGGGALLRNVMVNGFDLGAAQHADAGGGGGGTVNLLAGKL